MGFLNSFEFILANVRPAQELLAQAAGGRGAGKDDDFHLHTFGEGKPPKHQSALLVNGHISTKGCHDGSLVSLDYIGRGAGFKGTAGVASGNRDSLPELPTGTWQLVTGILRRHGFRDGSSQDIAFGRGPRKKQLP
jgi:hypothetical protein